MDMHTVSDRFATVTLLLMTLSLLACATLSPQKRADESAIQQISQAGAAARARPGDADAAYGYANALLGARNDGVWTRNPPMPREKFHEAQRLLEKAAEEQPAEAASLIGYKGVLHCEIGEQDACNQALERSMRIKPNQMAGMYLVGGAASNGDYKTVRELCAMTLPHLSTNKDVYEWMEFCEENSGAASVRAGIAWAPERYRDFYLQERVRRQQEQQRRVRAEQQREANENYCVADCRERGNLCLRDCYNENCRLSCENAFDACVDKCEIAY
jgi:tetratricopeptide (TPR) repeat protein